MKCVQLVKYEFPEIQVRFHGGRVRFTDGLCKKQKENWEIQMEIEEVLG